MPLCSSCIKTIAKTWKLSSLQLIFNDMPSLDSLSLNIARLLGNHRLHNNNLFPPGPGCSKLTTSLVNVSLKFQTLISEICQYFLLKKCEKLLQCKSFSHFFN